MKMTSEVARIKQGIVVTTMDFNDTKKVIGVSKGNITPNEQGVVPLGKQGAFEKEDKVEETFETLDIGAMSIPSETLASVDSLGLPTLDSNNEPTSTASEMEAMADNYIPEAPKNKFVVDFGDTITDSPFADVTNPMGLASMTDVSDTGVEPKKEEVVIETPSGFSDMELPEIPEALNIGEPSGINGALFESLDQSIVSDTKDTNLSSMMIDEDEEEETETLSDTSIKEAAPESSISDVVEMISDNVDKTETKETAATVEVPKKETTVESAPLGTLIDIPAVGETKTMPALNTESVKLPEIPTANNKDDDTEVIPDIIDIKDEEADELDMILKRELLAQPAEAKDAMIISVVNLLPLMSKKKIIDSIIKNHSVSKTVTDSVVPTNEGESIENEALDFISKL